MSNTNALNGLAIADQDLQLQTFHSDGRCSVNDIVRGSIANGRRIIGITDHAIGWDDGDEHCRFFMKGSDFNRYLQDIHSAQAAYESQGITVLAGLEFEINFDGTMALAPGILEVIGLEANILQYVDYVIGVIHSESFTVSLGPRANAITDADKASLLVSNIEALIDHPNVLIWGHPFQAVHGHFMRDFTKSESEIIRAKLRSRQTPLLLEYNLNPAPRYEEWQGKSTHYESGLLVPNDVAFFKNCASEPDCRFIVSTDAHDVAQTARLHSTTSVPAFINNKLAKVTNYLHAV